MTAAEYREKYLSTLDELEQLEQRSAAQAEFTRKTLINLSAAARGVDEILDGELEDLKAALRGGTGPEVTEHLRKVEQAVNNFEHQREEKVIQAAKDLNQITDLLLDLQISAATSKKLAAFKRGLQSRLAAWRHYPAIMSELADLQREAIHAATQPALGFLARLKGRKTLTKNFPTNGADAVVDNVVTDKDATENAVMGNPVPVEKPLSTPITKSDSEDDYEKVAVRIENTLKNLINNVDPSDAIKHKISIVRSRLSRGLDWYALSVTLEDIRDILMQRYLRADREFGDYLQRIDDELLSIGEALGIAIKHEATQSGAAHSLSSAVSLQVENIQNSVRQSQNLEQLKNSVSDHLDTIQNALVSYQHSQAEKDSLADQLEVLMKRVETIEGEARESKKQLEEQRYKATHDPLTQLPNREAFNERAFLEFQRYQRYKRPLTIAICDIDLFKQVNDTYGHQAGDKVIKVIAKAISTRLREVDFIARFGGEEFVVVMPETDTRQALAVLDTIRVAVAAMPFRFRDTPIGISISLGIAGFEEGDSVESVFERADKALYKAKSGGRNQCMVAAGKAS